MGIKLKHLLNEQSFNAKDVAKKIYDAKGFVWDNEFDAVKAILSIKDKTQYNQVQTELQKLTGGRGIGLDMTKYDLGMLMYTIYPAPEGELLKNIWVVIMLSKNITEYAEDYYEDVEFILPLCALEELYRSSGKGAINAEVAKLVEFDLPRQRMYWERNSKN